MVYMLKENNKKTYKNKWGIQELLADKKQNGFLVAVKLANYFKKLHWFRGILGMKRERVWGERMKEQPICRSSK